MKQHRQHKHTLPHQHTKSHPSLSQWVPLAAFALAMALSAPVLGKKPSSCDPRKQGDARQCKPKKTATQKGQKGQKAPTAKQPKGSRAQSILGVRLKPCSRTPMTGYFRDGYCHTGPSDRGVHVVCAKMTAAFLSYTKSRGNDLSSPAPQYGFPGLKPGDKWCLCAVRWLEAHRAGKAPKVVLKATNKAALRIVKKATLQAQAARTMKKK